VVLFESLALALSGIALFAYTNIQFTKGIIYGADGMANSIEQHSIMRLFGSVFIGVHILVSILVLGIYFVMK
jgi:hypothetical protein